LKILGDESMIDEFISPFRNPFYPLMLKIALNKLAHFEHYTLCFCFDHETECKYNGVCTNVFMVIGVCEWPLALMTIKIIFFIVSFELHHCC
jgi:hypothetical protein